MSNEITASVAAVAAAANKDEEKNESNARDMCV
jgi:hypothetical protein